MSSFDPEQMANDLSGRLDAEVGLILREIGVRKIGTQKRRWKFMLLGILCGVPVGLAIGYLFAKFFLLG